MALLPNAREGWPLGDILMLTVAFPLFLTTILYIIYLIRERRRRWLERAPQEVVDSLPSKIFYAHKRREREPQDCAICIEDFQDEEALRVLPCHHEFHQACIGRSFGGCSGCLRGNGRSSPWPYPLLLDPWLLTRKRSVRRGWAFVERVERTAPIIDPDPFSLSVPYANKIYALQPQNPHPYSPGGPHLCFKVMSSPIISYLGGEE